MMMTLILSEESLARDRHTDRRGLVYVNVFQKFLKTKRRNETSTTSKKEQQPYKNQNKKKGGEKRRRRKNSVVESYCPTKITFVFRRRKKKKNL